MTSAPDFISSLTTRVTNFSLPGMGFAEMMIKSLGVIVTFLWLFIAIRVSAESGSPWLPVVTSTIFSSG